MKLYNTWKAYVKLGIQRMIVVIIRAMLMTIIMVTVRNIDRYTHRKKM